MKKDNQKELYNLSNQIVETFIKDIFTKNNVNIDEAKSKVSEEQKESLKQSIGQLKEQVENFLYEKKATKKVTEKDATDTISPLREKFLKKKTDNSVEKDE